MSAKKCRAESFGSVKLCIEMWDTKSDDLSNLPEEGYMVRLEYFFLKSTTTLLVGKSK